MANDASEGIEAPIALPDLVAGLGSGEAFGETSPVDVVQTHASVVFLTPTHAYKVKKPVRFWGLLDYGTAAKRRDACEAEVRLNARLAPEIYLDVVRIVRRGGALRVGGRGRTLEHAVRMLRYPSEATLEERLRAGDAGVDAEVDRVAETLAEFHAAHRLAAAEGRTALPSRFGRVVRSNLQGTAGGVPTLFPAALHAGLRRELARLLGASRGTMRRRVAEGRTVDGHGDVRLEHVLRFRGRVAIVDCIEFNDALRRIDPLSDLAFPIMDLVAHGRPDLADRLRAAYLAKAPDPDAAEVLPLYVAYRALVRAAVDERTSRDAAMGEARRAGAARSARRHLVLAWASARTGRPPPLVLLRGPSGTGKSALATAIAPWLGADVHRSDVIRKELAGMPLLHRPRGAELEALYSSDASERTYREILARGEASVRAGRAALLDATFLLRDARRLVARRARALGAPFAILDVRCAEATVRERLRRRAREGHDPSDADFEVYESQVREAEPLDDGEAPAVVATSEADAPEDAAVRLAEALEAAGRFR